MRDDVEGMRMYWLSTINCAVLSVIRRLIEFLQLDGALWAGMLYYT